MEHPPRSNHTLSKNVGYYTSHGYRSLQNLPRSNEHLYLRYAGEEFCEPGYFFDLNREEYHLHIVLKGKGSFHTDGTLYHLKSGDMFLVPQNQPNYYQADQKDPWHYAWIAFGGSNAWAYLQKAGFSRHSLTRKANRPVEQYVKIVYEILKYPQLTYAHTLKRMAFFYEFLSLLLQSNTNGINKGTQQAYVERAIHCAQENYPSCTVAEMAEFAGVSRNYLFTLFKQQLHLSPQQYLTQYRMEKAASLLIHTENRVSDIAHAVGYEDPLSFTKTFKKIFRKSPLQFRKEAAKPTTSSETG